MATIEYSVAGQKITTTALETDLVSGTIGYYTAGFTFDSAWNSFDEIWAVFDPQPGTAYKNPVTNGVAEIPGEVMGGVYLRIGVFGVADGVEYPTVWANRLQLREGCFTEIPVSEYPEPAPIIAHLQEEIDAVAAEVETKADAADLAEKMDKTAADAEPGNIALIGNNRNISDSGKSLADIYDSAMISKTAEGSIVTITDGADGVPIKSMTVQIEPVQAGSGDPSPSNVRAISGRTEARTARTGKNLYSAPFGDIGITGRYISPSGTVAATSDGSACVAVFGIEGGKKYYIETCSKADIFRFGSKNSESQTAIGILGALSSYYRGSAPYNGALQTADGDNSIIIQMSRAALEQGAKIIISEEPIATISITFPTEAGTVYGGELTVNEDGTGTLTVDRKAVDMGTLNWVGDSISSAHRMLVTISDRRTGTQSSGVNALCESYDWYGTSTLSGLRSALQSGQIGFRDSNGQTMIRNDDYTDVDAFKASLSGQKLVYQLAEPITYALTAEEVLSTLRGLNNIWADTGDIAITYRADPTIALEDATTAVKESIASVEEEYTASKAYAVGDLVYVGETLYRVTTAISSGNAITPNTNCTATTISAEIKSLR